MANNYTDHAELRFELNHPLMKRIVELKERNFRDKDEYDYAPLDFDDAMDNYDRVLELGKQMFTNAKDFTFFFVGNYDEATLLPLIEQYIPLFQARVPN